MTDDATPAKVRLTDGLGPDAGCGQATPHNELLAQLMDPNVPKSEREHAAAREIEGLRVLLAKAVCTWPACACVRGKSAPCAKGFSVQAIAWPDFPSGGGPSGGLTQCDMHEDESY